MSSKNPFELRTEVLTMAKEYMDKQYEINLEMSRKMVEAGKAAIEDCPKMYSIDELTKKAQEMYSFVSKKD